MQRTLPHNSYHQLKYLFLFFLSLPQVLSQSFRIGIDYTSTDNYFNTLPSAANLFRYVLAKRAVNRAIDYYTKVLKVVNPVATINFPAFRSGFPAREIPASPTGGLPYDFYLVFNPFYDKSNATEFAPFTTFYEPTTGRPCVGELYMNLKVVLPGDFNHQVLVSRVVHELYHIFIMNYDCLRKFTGFPAGYITYQDDKFPKPLNYDSYGKGNLPLISTFQQLLAIYFGSPGSRLPLEGNGQYDGSKIFVASNYFPTMYSSQPLDQPSYLHEVILAIAEDSKWFTVDYTWSHEKFHGKGSFQQQQSTSYTITQTSILVPYPSFYQYTCPTNIFFGYCSYSEKNYESCSWDYEQKTRCTAENASSAVCYYYKNFMPCTTLDKDHFSFTRDYDSTYEIIGPRSRCAEVTTYHFQTTKCAKVTCSSDDSITYTFATFTCTCPRTSENQQVICPGAPGPFTTLKCPRDHSEFCQRLLSSCPEDCSGKGICIGRIYSKRCFCMFGWGGDDCSQRVQGEEIETIHIYMQNSRAEWFLGLFGSLGLIILVSGW